MSEKSIVMFDIDRTAYADWLLFPLFEQQMADGIVPITFEKPMYEIVEKYNKKDLNYESMVDRVVRKWAEALKGQSAVTVQNHTAEFLQTHANNFRPFVAETINLTRATHYSYFITGEPQFVAAATADMFKADGSASSQFSIKRGLFTGEASTVLASRADKFKVVKNLLSGNEKRGSMAFGDSEGDIEMLAAVQYPICVKPSEGLQTVAVQKKWFIGNDSEQVSKYVRNRLNV